MIDDLRAGENPQQRVIVADIDHVSLHAILHRFQIRQVSAVEVVHYANGFFPVRQQFPHERGTDKTGAAGDDAFGLHS